MTATINASTSGGGGIIQTADSSGILALQTGGTTAMTITAAQNVGIGTASPAHQLDVANGARAKYLQITNNGYAGSAATTPELYSPASATLAFGAGGAERMRLDSSGNLGLGVTPSPWSVGKSFELKGVGNGLFSNGAGETLVLANTYYDGAWRYAITNGYAAQYICGNTNGTHIWKTSSSAGTAGSAISFTQAMTLDASGKLNIGGTTTPSAGASQLSLSGYSGNDGGLQLNASGGAGGLIATPSGAGLRFLTYTGSVGSESYTERARIDSSGNLLIGTSVVPSTTGIGIGFMPGYSSSGTSMVCRTNTTSANDSVYFYSPNGLVGYIRTSGSSTSYVTSSDYRLKENIAPMTGALSVVAALKPCTYNWKVDGSDGQGFIAHELQSVVPDAVTGEKDAVDAEGNPQYQGIDTSFLVATLTAAIQEQQAIITTLTERISALEAK